MRARAGSLAAIAALAACQPQKPPVVRPTPPAPIATPTAAPATPTPVGTAVAALALPPEALPKGGSRVDAVALSGRVRLDASWIIANNGGSLVSNNGSNVLSGNGGGLISDKGGGFISDNGAGIIANNGGGIIANNGGGVISNHGGGLGPGGRGDGLEGLAVKVGFRLLQAPGVPAKPTLMPGLSLPVAGALVRAYSLRTGLPVELNDAGGQPIFPVRTNARGEFRAPIPASEQANVMFRADLPGGTDPRIRAGAITAPVAERALDMAEADAIGAAYLRASFQRRLAAVFAARDEEAISAIVRDKWKVPDAVKTSFRAMVVELRDAAVAAKVDTPEAQALAAQRAADAVLSRVDLKKMAIDPAFSLGYPGPAEPAMPALRALMRHMELGAGRRLAQDPAYFANQPWLVAANAGRAKPYEIKKAADLPAFVVDEYLSSDPDGVQARVREVFRSIGPVRDPATGIGYVARLYAGVNAVIRVVGTSLLLDEQGAKTEALRCIREAGVAAPPL